MRVFRFGWQGERKRCGELKSEDKEGQAALRCSATRVPSFILTDVCLLACFSLHDERQANRKTSVRAYVRACAQHWFGFGKKKEERRSGERSIKGTSARFDLRTDRPLNRTRKKKPKTK